MRPCRHRRAGLAFVDLLVAMAILIVVAGLLVVGLQHIRQRSHNSTACRNNLKQLGIALHNYHAVAGRFPVEDYDLQAKRVQVNPRWHQFSLYISLLPFIEQDSQQSGQKGMWMLKAASDTTPPGSGETAVAVYVLMCPARRTYSAGPRVDYAAATQWSMLVTDPVTGKAAWANSVLGAASMCATDAGQEAFKGTTLGGVAEKDGTSTTLFLSHKALSTTPTPGVSLYDAYWGDLSQPLPYDHNRDLWDSDRSPRPTPETLVPPRQDGRGLRAFSFGSPHPAAMPCLFVDGSVRDFAYDETGTVGNVRLRTAAVWQALWGYNDGVAARVDGWTYVEPR